MPNKWVKKNSINAGDDIEVEEDKSFLKITPHKVNIAKKSIKIDLSGMNETLVRWTIPALEKYGFDEIQVFFDEKSGADVIDEVIKEQFIGYIIINQTDKSCVIKNLTKDLENEFTPSFNRAFLVTISLANSCYEFIEAGKFVLLKNLLALEKTNNQLTNYCQRTINLGLIDDVENSYFHYVIVWNLEKICDNYKYICKFLINKNNVKGFSKETLILLKGTNALLESYYKIYMGFDIKKLNNLVEEKKKILQLAWSLLGRKNNHESVVIALLADIATKISDFTASTFAIKYSPQ